MATSRKPKKLNEKQKKFCNEYLITYNAKQSAIKAGYSAKTAEVIGNQLLNNTLVRGYLDKIIAKQQARTEITADKVLNEIAKVAFLNIKNMYSETGKLKEPQELDDNVSATISTFKSRRDLASKDDLIYIDEYKTFDKMKALELLGKRFALFTDKHQVEHSISDDMKEALLKASK